MLQQFFIVIAAIYSISWIYDVLLSIPFVDEHYVDVSFCESRLELLWRFLHKTYLNIRSYGTDCCVIGSHKFSFKITVSFPKWLYQVQSHRNVREFHLLHILAQNKLMLGMLEDGKEYLNCTFVYGFIAGLSFCQLTRLTILTTICIFLITVAPQ